MRFKRPFSDVDWLNTPEPVRKYIQELEYTHQEVDYPRPHWMSPTTYLTRDVVADAVKQWLQMSITNIDSAMVPG